MKLRIKLFPWLKMLIQSEKLSHEFHWKQRFFVSPETNNSFRGIGNFIFCVRQIGCNHFSQQNYIIYYIDWFHYQDCFDCVWVYCVCVEMKLTQLFLKMCVFFPPQDCSRIRCCAPMKRQENRPFSGYSWNRGFAIINMFWF